MSNIDLSKLAVIPYLDISNLNGRFISTLMFYDAGTWRMWMPAGDRLIEIKASPAESFYFATEPETPTDICFHFLDFIAQRASFSELQKPILGLRDDAFNLSASLAKISHLNTTSNIVGQGVSRMVVTEVEYLFSVCRSVFDLLQEIASALWETIKLHDSSVNKKPLKETFSKMVTFQGRASTEQELIERFGLPQPLAAYYVRNADFFMTLREFRDNIIHRGAQVQTIFSGETGFLIQHTLKPFSDMEIWSEEEKQPNDLIPLYPALCVVIHKTLSACEDFSSTIEQVIQFPPPIAPNMRFFMRGYFNEMFSAALHDAHKRLTQRR
ncbi:MAG: hypothetical protein HY799_09575 [Nitrosomonadales bacterium]|nr:hypothetical protein [Nitrosomonadales bacterium]